MIVTYRGHVNRFLVSAASRPLGDPVADKTMLAEVLLVMAALMLSSVGHWMFADQHFPFFKEFDTATKHEWINRANAVVMTALTAGFAAIQGYTSHWGFASMVAYMLHDTAHLFLYETDIAGYAHHIVVLMLCALKRTAMNIDQEVAATRAVAILESTSPLVSLSWLLNKAGYSDRAFFPYVAIAMVIWFGIQRILVFPWFLATKADTALQIVLSPVVLFNFFWFHKIIGLVTKKLAVKPGTEKQQ